MTTKINRLLRTVCLLRTASKATCRRFPVASVFRATRLQAQLYPGSFLGVVTHQTGAAPIGVKAGIQSPLIGLKLHAALRKVSLANPNGYADFFYTRCVLP